MEILHVCMRSFSEETEVGCIIVHGVTVTTCEVYQLMYNIGITSQCIYTHVCMLKESVAEVRTYIHDIDPQEFLLD